MFALLNRSLFHRAISVYLFQIVCLLCSGFTDEISKGRGTREKEDTVRTASSELWFHYELKLNFLLSHPPARHHASENREPLLWGVCGAHGEYSSLYFRGFCRTFVLLSSDSGMHCPSDTNPRLLTTVRRNSFLFSCHARPFSSFSPYVALSLSLSRSLSFSLSLSFIHSLTHSFSFPLSLFFFMSRLLGSVQQRATLLEFYWIAATAFIKLDVANWVEASAGSLLFFSHRPPTHPRYKYDATIARSFINSMHCAPRIGLFFVSAPSSTRPFSRPSLFFSVLYLRNYSKKTVSLSLSLFLSRVSSHFCLRSSRDFSFCFRVWVFVFFNYFPSLLTTFYRPLFFFLSHPIFLFLTSQQAFNLREEWISRILQKRDSKEALRGSHDFPFLFPYILFASRRKPPRFGTPFFWSLFSNITLFYFSLYCVKICPGNVFSFSDVGYSTGFRSDSRTVPAQIGLTAGRLYPRCFMWAVIHSLTWYMEWPTTLRLHGWISHGSESSPVKIPRDTIPYPREDPANFTGATT